jgi:XTP/dITP diphosphohydrolase
MKILKKLILATHNENIILELFHLFSGSGISILGLDQFPNIGEIDETGKTLQENAYIKAHEVHKITGLPTLADDTGLEVDLLNGAPGVYSARYAGSNSSYDDNVNKLLSELSQYQNEIERTARFKTVISFINNGQEFSEFGIIEGYITIKKFGAKGFGYDSIFKPMNSSKTFAQMSEIEKNKISHRMLAFNKIKDQLIKNFNKESI